MSDPKTDHPLAGSYLRANIGDEEFGLPLISVREVIAVPQITPIPHSPKHFLGLINLRGKIIPILDLRIKFKSKPRANSETSVIICEIENHSVGAVVDSVNSVIAVSSADAAEVPKLGDAKADFITGVYKDGKDLVLLMNLRKALTGEDLKVIAQAVKTSPAA